MGTRTLQKQKGFTLIELLVVVAIIGLLASIILASLNSARVKGRDARRIADIKEIQTALESYYSTNSKYPVQTATTVAGQTVTTALAGLISDTPSDIASIPNDPLGGTYTYEYLSDTNGTKYCLGAILEGATPSGSSATCSNSLTLATPTSGTLKLGVNP